MELVHLSLLKNTVQKVFGRKILTSSDCHHLANDIFRTCNVKISFNTIRRCFDLMKGSGHPSDFTINALATYCGFSSFDHFITAQKEHVATNSVVEEQVLLSFLTLLFKEIEVVSNNDTTYLSVVEQTIRHLQQFPFIIDNFQREIAKTKYGQTYYFEHFVFIDKLASYYGTGLHYYLQEKKTKDAYYFGHALLCYQSWLTRNDEALKTHYNKLQNYAGDHLLSASVVARCFVAALFYAEVSGTGTVLLLASARKYCLKQGNEKQVSTDFNAFEIVLCEALILTKHYEEASFYLEELNEKVLPNAALHASVGLFKAIVLFHMRLVAKAHETFTAIDPNNFSFLSKHLLNILYIKLKHALKTHGHGEPPIDFLIAETGFSRLSAQEAGKPMLVT